MTNKEMRKILEEKFILLSNMLEVCEDEHTKSITNAMLDIYVVLNASELLGYESFDFESKNTAPEVLAQEQSITLTISNTQTKSTEEIQADLKKNLYQLLQRL